MARTSTNISLDPELKRSSQELFADLGIDLSTAITLFFSSSLSVSRAFPLLSLGRIPMQKRQPR